MMTLKKTYMTTFIAGGLLLAGIVITVNAIFDNIRIGRFDLTADRLYKLSPSVQKILTDLEAPIDITYYVSSSEKMPTQWKNLERDVIDKLNELKMASKGRLDFTVFDPSAEEEKEAFEASQAEEEPDVLQNKPRITRKRIAERLYEKGVIPFGVQSTSQDEFAVKRVYSSLVLSYLDRKEEVIEEVRPETFGTLEYDVMSRIYKLISNRRPKIGFYPSQPEVPPQYRQYQQGPPPDMYAYAVQLLKEEGYDVKRTNIKEDDPVPDDIQTMLLMVDQPLSQRQLYEIDKLVHNGVRIVLCAQQNNYQISPSREPGQFDLRSMPAQLNINQLTENWGFAFDDQMFMDRNSAYIQVPVYQTQRMGLFQMRQQRLEPVTKPVIIKVDAEQINNRLSIANGVTTLFYMYGGRLMVHDNVMKESGLTSQILFTSSDHSWTRVGYGYGPVDVSPPVPADVLKRQPLGVLIEGTFPSLSVDKPPPSWEATPGVIDTHSDTTNMTPEITGPATATKIIAIGSSNIFKSDVLQSVIGHKALLMNAVDALTLGDELINIRSKNITARQIKNISTVGKAVAKGFVVWFLPVVFVAVGIMLNLRRRVR